MDSCVGALIVYLFTEEPASVDSTKACYKTLRIYILFMVYSHSFNSYVCSTDMDDKSSKKSKPDRGRKTRVFAATVGMGYLSDIGSNIPD